MGFHTVLDAVVTSGLNDAAGWIADFSGFLTVIVGVGVFGLAVGVIVRAVKG